MTFLPGNEKLTITQEFKGIDEHGHLIVSTNIKGQVPEVPPGSTVQVEPYSEIYQYSNNCELRGIHIYLPFLIIILAASYVST